MTWHRFDCLDGDVQLGVAALWRPPLVEKMKAGAPGGLLRERFTRYLWMHYLSYSRLLWPHDNSGSLVSIHIHTLSPSCFRLAATARITSVNILFVSSCSSFLFRLLVTPCTTVCSVLRPSVASGLARSMSALLAHFVSCKIVPASPSPGRPLITSPLQPLPRATPALPSSPIPASMMVLLLRGKRLLSSAEINLAHWSCYFITEMAPSTPSAPLSPWRGVGHECPLLFAYSTDDGELAISFLILQVSNR